MAALGPGWEALPFLRADERPPFTNWLAEEREWRFPLRGAAEDRAHYLKLCASMADASLLPDGRRDGLDLSIPLGLGPFQLCLEGRVLAEFLSSELGEAQRHLHSAFQLPGAWTLHWRLIAGQDLRSGQVRLISVTWVEPGDRQSFRHLIAARALRQALCSQMERTVDA